MTQRIVVLGAGPGGYVAAIRAAKLGADVMIVDADNVGGTCLNRGCIPSKVWKNTAELLGKFNQAYDFGIRVTGKQELYMDKLIARQDRVIQIQARGIFSLLKKHKIKYINGYGSIEGPNRLNVSLDDGKNMDVEWDGLIIATGSRPKAIPSIPFDRKRILSSDDIFKIKTLPKKIIILGGGVIGCEFAFILNAFGVDVTMVEAMPRLLPLPGIDEECVSILRREMKKRKIKCILNQSIEKVQHKADSLLVTIRQGDSSTELDADSLLVCIGRGPATADLGLETTGVETDSHGWIKADENMQTSAPHVFAIGDVLGPAKIMLAHSASAEALVAAENAMGNNQKMDYSLVPSAIFTMPEMADIGLTEAQCNGQDLKFRSDSFMFRNLGKAHVIGEIAGMVKIISSPEDGRILGVHIVGPHAADLIAEAVVAMKSGMSVTSLAETIHPHPTLSEGLMEAAKHGVFCAK